jgi:hypothetical protein
MAPAPSFTPDTTTGLAMPHAASPSFVPSRDGTFLKIKPSISQSARAVLSVFLPDIDGTKIAGFPGGISTPSTNPGLSADCIGLAEGIGSEETEDGNSNPMMDSTHDKKPALSIHFPRLDHTAKTTDN